MTKTLNSLLDHSIKVPGGNTPTIITENNQNQKLVQIIQSTRKSWLSGSIKFYDIDLIQQITPNKTIIHSGMHLKEVLESASNKTTALRINSVDKIIPQFRYIKTLFSHFYQSKTTMNLYHSQNSNECLGRHKDEYPIFIFQLYGEKQWIFDSVDYTLKEADILCIPRGLYHEVQTISQASTHITVGIQPEHITDHIKSILLASEEDLYIKRKDEKFSSKDQGKKLQQAIEVLSRGISDEFLFQKPKLDLLPHKFKSNPFTNESLFCLFLENIQKIKKEGTKIKIKTFSSQYSFSIKPEIADTIFSGYPFSMKDLISTCPEIEVKSLLSIIGQLKKKRVLY